MEMPTSPGGLTFGLLPEPEGRMRSFVTSSAINMAILGTILIIGMTARHVIQQRYEMTTLIVPNQHPPPPKIKPITPKLPPPPKMPKLALEAPKIQLPQPRPEPKSIQMEARLALPEIKQAKPSIIEAPQPKAALKAAMPAQSAEVHPSTAPVHLGETFGAKPNPNANRPATIAAIGNPYGGMQGPAVAPHGVVGSTGIGNGTRSGSNAGMAGKVASAGIPGATGTANSGTYGKVGSAGIPTATAAPAMRQQAVQPAATNLEVIS